ncbi:MAG: hypothetical protein ACNA8W_22765 [Bradymonadaceae bacterium]
MATSIEKPIDDALSFSQPWSTNGGRAALWALLTAFVGAAFWAQILLFPALGELRYSDGRAVAIIVYLFPLILLGAGILWRRSAVLLMLFPLSLLPALALLAEPDWAVLGQLANMAWLVATFAAYLAVSSAQGLALAPTERLEAARGEPARRSSTVDYRWFYRSRMAGALVVFFTIVYALFFDPAVAEIFSEHHGTGEPVVMAFSAVFMFFVWCVFVYMMILVPGANVEYDRRRLRRRLDEIAESGPSGGPGVRVAVLVFLGLMISALALWFV